MSGEGSNGVRGGVGEDEWRGSNGMRGGVGEDEWRGE